MLLCPINRYALGLAHRIDHDDQRLQPARSEVSTRRVGKMVRDLMNSLGRKIWEIGSNAVEQSTSRKDLAVQLSRSRIEGVNFLVGRIVERVHNLVNVFQKNARFRKAVSRCPDRQITGVFLEIES